MYAYCYYYTVIMDKNNSKIIIGKFNNSQNGNKQISQTDKPSASSQHGKFGILINIKNNITI